MHKTMAEKIVAICFAYEAAQTSLLCKLLAGKLSIVGFLESNSSSLLRADLVMFRAG